MKVLLKEAADRTLVLLEVEEINYNPEELVLNIWSSQSSFEIRDIEKANADYIVNDAFRCDKVDLSMYEAVRDEED